MIGIKGRHGPLFSPFHRGSGGTLPLLALGRPPGESYDFLCEIAEGGDYAIPLRQAVYDDPVGGPQQVHIPDEMRDRPELLQQVLKDRGLENAKPRCFCATNDEIPWVKNLLEAVADKRLTTKNTPPIPPQKFPLTVRVTVTSSYFRAIAKIAFHYTLKMFPDLSGMEPELTPLKEFIWIGEAGDVDRFVRQRPDQFVENFRRGWRPTHWMHILGVKRSSEGIIAYAQFFAGPNILPPGYEIRIGKEPARIIRSPDLRTHQFVILDPTASPGVIGKMVDATPANCLWLPF
jgi:hypothetical protein